jgi:L-ascorbate metabolism protein UlaG (beta-lactamase superfamily)
MADAVRYRLAESACVEPLVAGWAAWPHTFAPVAYSLHLLNYQLPVLRSFLGNPRLHETSCRNPRLLGGAFVDVPSNRVEDVRALHEALTAGSNDNIEFAQALLRFCRELVDQAKGQSLDELYARLPEPLRGYVELLYDYMNHPFVRCLEGRMYRSRYYKPQLQSLRLFDLQLDEDRRYFMSTPRLASEDAVSWRIAFEDARLDALFRMDVEPGSREEIREVIGVAPEQNALFKRLFRESGERGGAKWRGEGLRIRYFGHACALVETQDVAILVDALVAPKPHETSVDRFSYADLPEHIDYALITHGHHDHFVIETLLRLRRRIGTVVVPNNSHTFYADFSLRLMAERLGFRRVREVECFDEIAFEGGRIVAVPFLGEHNDLPSAKSAYLIQAGGKSVMFAADSNCLDEAIYEPLHELSGPINALFVGMESVGAPLSWVYGPMLPIKPDHYRSQDRRSSGCNSERALKFAAAVRCERAFVYAVGREPWLKYILAINPSENDAYMTEIGAFIERLKRDHGVEARLLFGKSEIFI